MHEFSDDYKILANSYQAPVDVATHIYVTGFGKTRHLRTKITI